MKNILNTKTDGTPALLSNVDEAGNSLYVNGTEISSSQWIGEGTYTFTVGSHTYTISKAPDNDGNYQLLKVSDYTYQFVKIVSKSIREEIDDIETALSALESDAVTKSAGGQITGGGLSFTSDGMPQQTTGSGVAITMDGFPNGGQLKWQSWDNVTVGKAKDSVKLDGAIFKAGTKVIQQSVTAKLIAIFTDAQINTLLGVTGSGKHNTFVFAVNGDYVAEKYYYTTPAYENGTWYIRNHTDTNFTTGPYRVNYLVIRFA